MEGQFPPNFGQKRKGSAAANAANATIPPNTPNPFNTANTANITPATEHPEWCEHFALTARLTDLPGQSGV